MQSRLTLASGEELTEALSPLFQPNPNSQQLRQHFQQHPLLGDCTGLCVAGRVRNNISRSSNFGGGGGEHALSIVLYPNRSQLFGGGEDQTTGAVTIPVAFSDNVASELLVATETALASNIESLLPIIVQGQFVVIGGGGGGFAVGFNANFVRFCPSAPHYQQQGGIPSSFQEQENSFRAVVESLDRQKEFGLGSGIGSWLHVPGGLQ